MVSTQVDVDEGNTRRQLSDAQHHVTNAQEAAQVAESVLIERRRVVEEQAAKATEVKVGATQSRERADRERSVLGQLDRSIAELNAREDRLREDVAIAEALGVGARREMELLHDGLREGGGRRGRHPVDRHQAVEALQARQVRELQHSRPDVWPASSAVTAGQIAYPEQPTADQDSFPTPQCPYRP